MRKLLMIALSLLVSMCVGCSDDEADGEPVELPTPSEHHGVYGFAGGCYAVHAVDPTEQFGGFMESVASDEYFAFQGDDEASAANFYIKATDLGTYLFYDDDEHYWVGNGSMPAAPTAFERQSQILSDIFTLDDDYLPGVQWELEESVHDAERFQLRHVESGQYLTPRGWTDDVDEAALLTFVSAHDCAEYPELTLDADGEVEKTTFDDGTLFGFVETHSHILTNFGFGGAGMFHGSAFHPFGVGHALPSCEMFHGEEGRADLFGFGFEEGTELDEEDFIVALTSGETPEFNHHTEGYPEFTDWPSAHDSSTHQTQYYKWIERAWRGGLRLMVQHATTNQMICELLAGTDTQPTRYSCDDMVAVDRQLEEIRRMERYIDAQHGGPGEGWFRIVESPDEARAVIEDGDLAIILGIETSNLFECLLVPPDGRERCDEQDVVDALDHYYGEGVRAIFPVHKYDNAFSAGDGHRGIIELGNFMQTGHWSNFTDDCPDIPTAFDSGDVEFGDLNDPRDDYLSDPPHDMSGFSDDPLRTLLPHAGHLAGGSLTGDYCQNAGLTALGEFLMQQLMERGMIIEIDHLPRRSYERAFEMLEDNDYPAVGSHGNHNEGKLYGLGGVSKFNFGSCSDPDEPGTRIDGLNQRLERIEDHGGYPAEGFGFDLNGFAGAPGPRFGEHSVCGDDQQHPVTYPFDSVAGDVTFTQPRVGEREIDFNEEGLAHIGLIPEHIQDVRHDGVTDEQLEPLFKSAEGYLRMWERSIERGEALGP